MGIVNISVNNLADIEFKATLMLANVNVMPR